MNSTDASQAPIPAIARAVELAGGQSAVAHALSTGEETITPQAVGHWVRKNRIPAERVLDLERLIDARVTRHELRPDIYPLEAAA